MIASVVVKCSISYAINCNGAVVWHMHSPGCLWHCAAHGLMTSLEHEHNDTRTESKLIERYNNGAQIPTVERHNLVHVQCWSTWIPQNTFLPLDLTRRKTCYIFFNIYHQLIVFLRSFHIMYHGFTCAFHGKRPAHGLRSLVSEQTSIKFLSLFIWSIDV